VLAYLTSPHQDLLVRAERRRQKFFNDFSRACARTLRGSLWAEARDSQSPSVPVLRGYCRHFCFAQLRGRFDKRIEHGLQIER
jgi:hypothetical protein